MMRVREDDVPLRITALLLMNLGDPQTEVARRLAVSRVTLIKWKRRFEAGGWSALLRDDTGTWTRNRKERTKAGRRDARSRTNNHERRDR